MSEINFQDITATEIKTYDIKQELTVLKTAKRHAVKINNIVGQQNTYSLTNSCKSRELITEPVKNIAVFCNEYVPAHFPDSNYFKYILTINGVDHEVVPINSNRNGKKVIRTTDYSMPSDYVEYINEDIKSAFLSITINLPNNKETTYISNLKVLIGGNENV